ncbi:MAG TPA: hypothetical protein VGR73_02080 [Bryobacteraceae bacterium]|nr:hypothetical protein [Bryobacteraceae bacterium]
MSTPNAIPPVRPGNPLVKILLSAALLGIGVYLVQTRGAPKSPARGVAVVPSLRSNAPSSEGSKSFAWIPRYPGANIANIRTRETSKILSYGFEFQSADASAAVAAFFESGLRTAGLTVVTRSPSAGEIDLHGESPDRKRLIDVGVDKAPSGATVTVSATEQ